jgi:4-hydroxybenzoate polyprenyltransferase
MHTDIQDQATIFQKTPASWHPFIKIARLDRPIGTWLLLFPALWGLTLASGGVFKAALFYYGFLFALGAVLMRSAGCIVNDIWDRDLDGAVERTRLRPLPAGQMSVKKALGFLSSLLFASLLILIEFNWTTIWLGVISLALVAAYPLMKRITWWPQLFLGLTFNWGALMGWAAVHDSIGLPAVLMYIGGVFWTLGYDTIYAFQDKEDDALAGIKSTARLFGDKSRIAVAACYALALLFFAAAALAGGVNAALIILPAAHAAWQLLAWDMTRPDSALRIFRSNRIFGWLMLLLYAGIF